jgi:thiol-disulfide isomerase/thioredoxin
MMKRLTSVQSLKLAMIAIVLLTAAGIFGVVQAQDSPQTDNLEAIETEFEKEINAASAKRLSRIAALAEKTKGQDGDTLWRLYFDSVISEERFTEAEPSALKLLQEKSKPLDILSLAEVTSILAMAKRGELEQSIVSVQKFLATPLPGPEEDAENLLPVHVRLGLVEIYLRTLIDAGRYDLARKAIDTISAATRSEEVRDYLANEKLALQRIGKPVPPIKGVDVDGRAFDITALRGKPLLVLFWATWDEVSESQIENVIALTESYREKDLEVIAINVDRLRQDVEPGEELATDVRRFLIERNLLWKCLISETGDKDYASQLGVRYLPANLVVDAQGIIRHVDRTPAGLAQALAEMTAQSR